MRSLPQKASYALAALTGLTGLTALTGLTVLSTMFVSMGVARADGLIYIDNPPQELRRHFVRLPGRRPRPHFPMQVTRHRVTVEIQDTVVHTRIEETFYNPSGVQLEGQYIFPMPPDSVIGDFRMKMGGKEVAGEVLERDKARKIYEDIVRRARDPGLLEYVERGLFKARVFPIPPRGGVDVVIEYSQSLKREGGMAQYVYPLDTGKYATGDYKNVVIDVKLRSTQAIRSLHCSSHKVSIDRKGDREARIGFEAKSLRADKDFVLTWNVSEDALAPVLMTHRGHEKLGHFMLSIAPRPHLTRAVPPKDVIFVIDTSGSMTGRKIEQARKAIQYCVGGLNEHDRFNIIDFSTEARRFREGIVDVSKENRAAALAYVESFKARGGTNIEEALRFALSGAKPDGRLRIVVLLTDGEPTIGVTLPEDLLKSVEEHNQSKQRIFVFGVGEDLNAKLLDSIVKSSRGASQYIRGDQNLEVPISNFYDKIDSPVLTNISMNVRGGGISSVFPRPLPDLFHGEQLDIFGQYESEGYKTIVIKGTYAGEPRVFEYSLEFKAGKNTDIPRLWALRHIGHLLEEMRLHGQKKELKDEVIRLSKLHGIITPYTSYLILEEGELASRERLRAGRGAGASYRYAPVDLLSGLELADAAKPEAATAATKKARSRLEGSRQDYGTSSGGGAVRLSRRLGELKKGDESLALKALDKSVAQRAGLRLRQVEGRAFYLQGDRWIDSLLATRKIETDEKLKTVKYLSDEYFALLKQEVGIGKLLSLGDQIAFLWKGKIISIVK